MKVDYDYIFTGAGCAGLSLVMRLIESGDLKSKKVLILDKSSKTSNDRTWCFWEKKAGFFESLVYHSWTSLSIYGGSGKDGSNYKEGSNYKDGSNYKEGSNYKDGSTYEERSNYEDGRTYEERSNYEDASNYQETFDIAPYRYKMIRGIDFYNHCLNQIKANPNITILCEEVLETGNINESAFAKTTNGTYTASYVFNSILPKELSQKISPKTQLSSFPTQSLNHSLTTHHSPLTTSPTPLTTHHLFLQHFKGFVIRSPTAVFDPNIGTLMDFRISQKDGTSFVYVLPLSKHEALVEYTLFTGQLLQQEDYDQVVYKYIEQILKINSYEIVSSEFGVIPMTNIPFPPNNGRVINIGTAGGQTKPSTGYTFVFIQKQVDLIASLLAAGKFPVAKKSFTAKKFHWYDSILLQVLATGKLPGAFIFTELFRRNKVADVFRFLDNESNLFQDLKVIKALPTFIFAGAALRQVTKPPGSPVLHT